MTKSHSAAKGSAMQAALMVPDEDEDVREAPAAPIAKPVPRPEKLDGRSLHATGRTHQFATRIKRETHEKMLDIVQREKVLGQPRFSLAELLELAIEAYERERK